MGKRGPCRHCGITSTPLWRNGPPEKPVLCNACGSRWRTKGSLANYTPLHAREPINWEMPEVARARSTSNKLEEEKLRKRKLISVMVENDYEIQFSDSGQNSIRNLDEDASNRSSSGPEISYSESCAYFGNNETCDWTGSAQSNTWDSLVPSKKRSLIRSKPSSVEKLTKDLYSIWHEQQSSNLSGFSDDDLLFEDETFMGSDEIGHGGVLLGYPWPKATEEESEASSLPSYDKDKFSPEILNMLQERDPLLLSANLEDEKGRQVDAVKSPETSKSFFHYCISTPNKRHFDCKDRHLEVSKVSMKSPRRMQKSFSTSPPPSKNSGPLTSEEPELQPDHAAEDVVDNDGSCFSPRSLFTSPPDGSSMLRLTGDDGSDPDLHLENHTWIHKTASNSSQPGSGVSNEEGILSNFHAVRA